MTGRAFLYARVSSTEQVNQQSIRNQLEYGERYAALQGFVWASIFADDGVTGTLPLGARPEGARLLETAKRGDAVYVLKLDRLGRSVRVILSAVELLEQAGCAVRSCTEPFDTSSPTGRFLLTILSGVSELERDAISERTAAGRERKALSGGWTGGPPSYGYRLQGLRREAQLVPEEDPRPGETFSRADVIRLMFRLALEEGWGTPRIAGYLNSLHIPTTWAAGATWHGPSGKANLGSWSAPRVYNLLTSRTYAGEHVFGKRRSAPPIVRHCPAIVPRATWEQVQRLLAGRRVRNEAERSRWLLSGLLRCGACGSRYAGRIARYHGRIYRYYHCGSRYLLAHGPACPNPSLPASCEEEVWAELRRWIEHPEGTDLWLAEQEAVRPDPRQVNERAALDGRIIALEGERKRLLALYRRGVIDDAELEGQLADVRGEEAGLRTRLAEHLRCDPQAARPLALAARERLVLMQPELALADTPELRRRVLVAVGPRLTVRPGEMIQGKVRGVVEFRLF